MRSPVLLWSRGHAAFFSPPLVSSFLLPVHACDSFPRSSRSFLSFLGSFASARVSALSLSLFRRGRDTDRGTATGSSLICGVGASGFISGIFGGIAGSLGDRGEPGLGLRAGEAVWAEGQVCWFRQAAHKGETGKQTCCPKPTNSQFISRHRSLQERDRESERERFSLFHKTALLCQAVM